MSDVLRNVGELASPYYLLELWARQFEIDLDPETYATLKRKTRGLVRDQRAFELRGDPVDDDWRAVRREILGLTDPDSVQADALHVAVHDADADARLLFGELDPEVDPDARDAEADLEEPPATTFESILEEAEANVLWGLLLCGIELRLYRRGTGISQQYLALDLEGLVVVNDPDLWKAFAGLFRLPAFRPDDDGVPLIQRVCDESRAHATRLADDMRDDVVFAAEALIQAAIDNPENAPIIGQPPEQETLATLFEETLYVLYRLLFILFAEARGVLPISDNGPYATTYSLDHLVERARAGSPRADGYVAGAVRRLFGLLWSGPKNAASALGVDVLGGELFSPDRTATLDQLLISDDAWNDALLALAVGAAGGERHRLGRRSSFTELGVEQLGSIYEGLLVLEPRLVEAPAMLVGPKRERRVLPPELVADKQVIAHLDAGAFVLESSSGRRKGSGSFYTPDEITEFITTSALEPLVDPLVELAHDGEPDDAEKRLLALRVCDPAMGSGAFLVQAARVLGRALARIRAARRGSSVTPDSVKRAESEVVRRCLYGVDLNPLAVSLAKVSLWLETLQSGHPLSFLDTRLRVGDSLAGVRFHPSEGDLSLEELTSWPKGAADGLKEYLKKVAGEGGEPLIEQLKGRKALPRRKQDTLPGIAADEVTAALRELVAERARLSGVDVDDTEDPLQLELDAEIRFKALAEDDTAIRNRLRRAADYWAAQWFWPDDATYEDAPLGPPGQADFNASMGQLLNPGQGLTDQQAKTIAVAESVAKERHFFHWDLEFPEVMVNNGGFDAVIGNPPWNTLSPDVKEFFSTYDPVTFKKGVPKNQQDARRVELCEDPEINGRWQAEARRLHELGAYVKPKAKRYTWFPEEGNLRKGDANIFRQFVERAYMLLRSGGRLGQVLPDSVYVSSPATELRHQLLEAGRLEYCFVFENRKHLFPIDSRIKIVLLGAEAGAGPTEDFAAAFVTGKDAADRERAIGLDQLPAKLAELTKSATRMTREQINTLSPQTLAFPELVTPLDTEIALKLARENPPLNLDERGWGLTYCRELDADKDAWRFHTAEQLEELGAKRDGLYWHGPDGQEWWPLVEGFLFYHLEFPAEGKEPNYWVNAAEVRSIQGRKNDDGTSVMDHWRVAWRDVASATNERSAVATVLPPGCAAKDKAPTVWGGSKPDDEMFALGGLMSSFSFDYLVRFRGATSLKYGQINSVPAPELSALSDAASQAALLVRNDRSGDDWEVAAMRARLDATVAQAYELKLAEYTAILSSFSMLDRIQPMLPGEPKAFVTRDLALSAFAELLEIESPELPELLAEAGIDLPMPTLEYRTLDQRLSGYRELGAVPYRPTPRGGRPPTDPALIEAIRVALEAEPQTAEEMAERVNEDQASVKKVLQRLAKDDEIYAQGRGASRGYYVMEE